MQTDVRTDPYYKKASLLKREDREKKTEVREEYGCKGKKEKVEKKRAGGEYGVRISQTK